MGGGRGQGGIKHCHRFLIVQATEGQRAAVGVTVSILKQEDLDILTLQNDHSFTADFVQNGTSSALVSTDGIDSREKYPQVD